MRMMLMVTLVAAVGAPGCDDDGKTADDLVRRVMQHLPAPPKPLQTHVRLDDRVALATPA